MLILTQTTELETNRQAAAAMRDLASNINYKAIMAEEGCLTRAIELMRDNDLQLRILGAGAIRHMSINTRVKRPIIQEGALGPIFAAIEDELQDVDLIRQCAAIIGNIAENGENQIILVKDGLLPRLIHLGSFPHVEVQADASRTYALLSSNAENHVGVFGAVDVKAILKLTASEEEAAKRDALVAIGNISVMIKNQLMVAKLGGLVAVSLALDSSFESCQRFACRDLCA